MSWNLRPFKANWRGHKQWEPNVANDGGFLVSQTIGFFTMNCLTALCKLENVMMKESIVGPNSSRVLGPGSCNHVIISTQ
jgi:hypothetical protein